MSELYKIIQEKVEFLDKRMWYLLGSGNVIMSLCMKTIYEKEIVPNREKRKYLRMLKKVNKITYTFEKLLYSK